MVGDFDQHRRSTHPVHLPERGGRPCIDESRIEIDYPEIIRQNFSGAGAVDAAGKMIDIHSLQCAVDGRGIGMQRQMQIIISRVRFPDHLPGRHLRAIAGKTDPRSAQIGL